MREAVPDLRAVCAGFALRGDALDAEPLGAGHIHDTFVVTGRDGRGARRWVLQRLNERVFPDVAGMMENVGRVARHLGAPILVPAADGADWLRDGRGAAWRAFEFVEGSETRAGVASAAEARTVARAFGAFQRALASLPPPGLREHLPGFHDGAARWAALHSALAADPANRASRARPEIESLGGFAHLADFFDRLAARGVPRRAVHNDTKPDNLLRDTATGEPLAVIDLDTVMPGQGLADFGDLARAASCRAPEDEPDPARVSADPERFAGLARGFLEGAGDLLLPLEREALVDAAMALAWEQAVRFLADWVSGDAYYPVRRPGHNLERCRAQIALLRSLAAQGDALRRRMEGIASGEGHA
jgi:Ser/Thr protein kinase RdoA (MazF antagonist)